MQDNDTALHGSASESGVEMARRLERLSPRRTARVTGAFYLLTIVAGLLAQGFISPRLIMFSNAEVTATNLLAHESLFQLGFTVYMIEMASQIVFITLFYLLLKPVSRTVSLIAVFLGLAGCFIKIFTRLFYIAPLSLLGDKPYLKVFDIKQVHALLLLLLKINDLGAGIALGFLGFHTILFGFLIFRSNFLPRILGAWSMLAGLGWLTFLWPTVGYALFPYLAGFGFLGAIALIFWLLVFGVNEERWWERAIANWGTTSGGVVTR